MLVRLLLQESFAIFEFPTQDDTMEESGKYAHINVEYREEEN